MIDRVLCAALFSLPSCMGRGPRPAWSAGRLADDAFRPLARSFFAATFTFLVASQGIAETQTWSVQYLKQGAAHGNVVTEKGKHQFTEAYVRAPENVGLYIGCYFWDFHKNNRIATTLRIANGMPFSGHTANVHAEFENGAQVSLGKFSYAGGGYHSYLEPALFVMLLKHRSIHIKDTSGALDVLFPLDGIQEAVEQIQCQGSKD